MQEKYIKRNCYPAERRNETTEYEAVCNFISLYNAEERCHRGVGYKNSVSRFHMLKLSRIYELSQELKNGEYKTELGKSFEIFEPKHRIVTSTKYKDRIPQTSFVLNYYYPYIVPNLIDANYACLKEKGVDIARNKLKQYLRESSMDSYCLKADMKSYFASIDHEVLLNYMKQFFFEEELLLLYKDVVECNGKSQGLELGSEINQLSATSFLNEIDHALEKRGKYLRYMDDLLFIGSKTECEDCLSFLKEETAKLKIMLSPKKTYIQPIKNPISFLGFTFLRKETGRITMKRKNDKLKHEKRKLLRMKKKGVPFERVLDHYQSVRAVMKKGSRSGVVKLDKYFNTLFKEDLNNGNNPQQH